MQCPTCNKNLPDECFSDLVINTTRVCCCAVCALQKKNEAHGLPKDQPFEGEQAHAMFAKAVRHLEKTNQHIPKWAKRVLWKK